MAGGDPATAVDDRLLAKVDRVQTLLKIGNRTVKPVLAEIAAVEEVECTRNMASLRVERFGIASISGRRPRVDDGSAAVDGGDNLVSGDDPCPMRRNFIR